MWWQQQRSRWRGHRRHDGRDVHTRRGQRDARRRMTGETGTAGTGIAARRALRCWNGCIVAAIGGVAMMPVRLFRMHRTVGAGGRIERGRQHGHGRYHHQKIDREETRQQFHAHRSSTGRGIVGPVRRAWNRCRARNTGRPTSGRVRRRAGLRRHAAVASRPGLGDDGRGRSDPHDGVRLRVLCAD